VSEKELEQNAHAVSRYAENTQELNSSVADRRLLTIVEVSIIFGVCGRTVNRLVASGELPQPIKVGRTSRWLQEDIDEKICEMKHKRDSKMSHGEKGGRP